MSVDMLLLKLDELSTEISVAEITAEVGTQRQVNCVHREHQKDQLLFYYGYWKQLKLISVYNTWVHHIKGLFYEK